MKIRTGTLTPDGGTGKAFLWAENEVRLAYILKAA